MRQMAGTAAPSLTATLIEEALSEGTLTAEHEEDIKGAAASSMLVSGLPEVSIYVCSFRILSGIGDGAFSAL